MQRIEIDDGRLIQKIHLRAKPYSDLDPSESYPERIKFF